MPLSVGFGAVIVLIMLRLPVAIAMGAVGVEGVTYTTSWNALLDQDQHAALGRQHGP